MKKKYYDARFTVQLDKKTADNLRIVMITTERKQADALRFCINKTADAILMKGENLPEINGELMNE